MKPIDSRLLKYAATTRAILGLGSFFALLKTAGIIVWTFALANLIVAAAAPLLEFENETSGRALESLNESLTETEWALVALVALLVRAASSWGTEVLSAAGGVKVKSQLREKALANLSRVGPAWLDPKSRVDITLRLTRGLDALDKYFSQFFPQFIYTAVTTPILVLTLLYADLTSGLIVVIVFPLMPLFMALIGFATQGAQDKQWRALQTLSAAYMSVLSGIETLKIFRMERPQVRRVREITEQYRTRTMKVLRMTFISGFVLDLGATLSVAIVAVTVGTRLVEGTFPLITGLFILLLLPETFVAVRNVGAAFHASGEGVSAAEDVFEVIEATQTKPIEVQDASDALVKAVDVVLKHESLAINDPVSFTVSAGEMVALTGESGAGKSTLLKAVMGFAQGEGTIIRKSSFAYVGQRPALSMGTVFSNITLGDESPDRKLAQKHLELFFSENDSVTLDTKISSSNEGVSGGQAQRIAIARALYYAERFAVKLLILDEPTSQLDDVLEQKVFEILHNYMESGAGILVVTHSPWLASKADKTVRVRATQQEGVA